MATTVLTRRSHGLATVVALIAAVAAAAAFAVNATRSSGGDPEATRAVPEWFAPIAKSYGNNPKITPRFDFASLYASYPRWFERIAKSYGYDPAITPDFDFASLYGAPRA